ncbi:chromate resistance protein ChrB domain-containing protein [Anaeromyxobacter paludicola]|uniref:ChrB protein n=1 Tax=Anaeromyxobacter paludicola TaxID=2918171 RepID=A0ABN6N5D0_9BACT|nr:chromate resistance protein ChrB domain-containing protein [Anaeromyxobacter paludicola]BDG07293.1 chrB protein [Anaeromyxobacter paludicola]
MRPHAPSAPPERTRWLVLIHQIPPRPAYLRVKIGRHLQRIGAVAIKNSVYALPHNEETQEDFQWVLREVVKGGGDASMLEAHFIEGLSDGQVLALFQAAREADYREVAEEARKVAASLPRRGPPPENRRNEVANQVARLRRRLSEVEAIDFFGAPGREIAEGVVSAMESRMKPLNESRAPTKPRLLREDYRGRTWVTRTGIKVDRMASAWLIRKIIDPEARFKFVPAKGYAPQPGELRFDMFDAEFTHDGDLCTFEVLLQRFGIDDPGLRAIAEIVHDVDVKDAKYGREEASGVGQVVAGIAAAHAGDEARLERGAALFEDLYALHRTGDAAR